MNILLNKIFDTKGFTNSNGQIIPIHSHTSQDQCSFLQRTIEVNKFSTSIEIGLAYGVSTLAIVESIAKNNGHHIVIDKFQHADWGGNGLDLIRQAGYIKQIDFYEEYCYEVLPKLLSSGERFDFAYIDSTKQFDWLLVDFFFLDKLLNTGGIIVFDDADWAGIRKLLRLISQFPSYRVYADSKFPINQNSSTIRQWFEKIGKWSLSKKLLKEELIQSDYELKLNSHCVALQKIEDDNRKWNWHVNF